MVAQQADRALTESGMMAAILSDPADDVARLVFADWCDENRRPERAAFVREQVARPDWSVRVEPHGGELTYRGKVLFRTPEPPEDDGSPLAALLLPPAPAFVFRRGFPDELELPNFYTAVANELRAFPITRLVVRGVRPLKTRRRKGAWSWERDGHEGGVMLAHQIPGRLFDLLATGDPDRFRRRYASEADALADLSAALLKRAREGK